MAKRHGALSDNKKMSHPHKTKKRLQAKRNMLAARVAKKSK